MPLPINHNSFSVPECWAEILPAEIKHTHAMIYFFMLNKQARDGMNNRRTFISSSYIARQFRLGVSTVERVLRVLQEVGLITLIASGGGITPNEWEITEWDTLSDSLIQEAAEQRAERERQLTLQRQANQAAITEARLDATNPYGDNRQETPF